MSGKNFAGKLADRFGSQRQFIENLFWKATGNPPFPQLGSQRILAALAPNKRSRLVDFPHPVTLQVIEREFWMRRLARRAEFFQKCLKRPLQLIETDHPLGPGLKLPKGVKHEKRFVRSSLVAAPPHVESPEPLQQRVCFRHDCHNRLSENTLTVYGLACSGTGTSAAENPPHYCPPLLLNTTCAHTATSSAASPKKLPNGSSYVFASFFVAKM